MKNLSVHHNMIWPNDVDFGYDEYFVIDQNGYVSIYDDMLKFIRQNGGTYHLQHEVSFVNYEADNVFVNATDTTTGKHSTFAADQVVSTASIGALNGNTMKFNPPIPAWKKAAMEEVNMGLLAKVVVEFDKAFWKKDEIYIVDKEFGYYPYWKVIHNTKGKAIIVGFIGADAGKKMEASTDAIISKEMETLFSKAFGSKKSKINFKPKSIYRTSWSQDKHF